MRRGNLSTRPFYNERLVHIGLASATLLVVAATVFNTQRLVSLTTEERTLAAQVAARDDEARTLQQEAQQVRTSVDQDELQEVADRAAEANALIARRGFSWTALFNYLEATIPADVRLEAVQPTIDRGLTTVTLIVVGRSVAAIDSFMEQLEQTGAFEGLLSREEQLTDDGTYRATLEGVYAPGAAVGPEAPPTSTAELGAPAQGNVDVTPDSRTEARP